MRKGQKNIKGSIFFFMLAFLVMTSSQSFAQKGHYMSEEKLIQNYKMSVKYFEEGKKLYREEKFNKAEKKFKKCLEVCPQHAQANFYLAHLMYNKSNLEDALHYIEEAKKNHEIMNQMLALAYVDYMDNLREKKDELRETIDKLKFQKQQTTHQQESNCGKLDIQITNLQGELGVIQNKLSKPLHKEEQVPDNYFYLTGNIYFKLKKFKEAHDQYIQVINQNPEHQGAYNNLINIYLMAKQYERAMSMIEQAESRNVVINPNLKNTVQTELDKKVPRIGNSFFCCC